MKRLAQAFLSGAGQEKVLSAVRAAEGRCACEIVPMVVGASDSYPKAELACAMTLGLVGGVVASLVGGTRDMWLFLFYFGLFTLAGFQAATRLPRLKRPFVSPKRARHETRQAAQAAFYVHRLGDTRQRNALLVYVSVFERLAFLLPDSGLAAKLPHGRLDAAAGALTEAIRQGGQAEALAEAIDGLAAILAPLYPLRPDDANELQDLVVS